MEMTNKEFSAHFSDAFTPEIKAFGFHTLLMEGFDCLIVTDREDKEKAYCTHCKKWVKIPGDTVHTGSPKSIRAAEVREYNRHCCHHGAWGMTEADIELEKAEKERRKAIEKRKRAWCPECHNVYAVYHQWRMNMGQMDGYVSISVFEKSKVQPDAVVLRRIEVERHYGNGDEPVVKDKFVEAERYLFRMGQKTVRQNCIYPKYIRLPYVSYGWKRTLVKKFVKSIYDNAHRISTSMWSDPIKGHYRMNIGSLLDAIKGTPYQYLFNEGRVYLNHYDQYEFKEGYPLHVIGLMDLYSLHPWIELLMKNTMENIVIDHLGGKRFAGAISWRAKSIKSAVKRFTKKDLKDIVEFNKNVERGCSRVQEKALSVLAEFREKAFPKMTLAYAMVIANEERETLDRLIKIAGNLKINIDKAIAYCVKQNKGKGHAVGDWLDYLGQAEKLRMDLSKESNIFPKNLARIHANLSRQIKYQHDKELDEQLKATLATRNKIFRWKGKKYFIRPAESTKELVAEGKTLHHCVGGYAERHAKGETTILFVRDNENPDKPLYTMEVRGSEKEGWHMVQIRAKMNGRPPEEVLKMVKQFMERVNNKGKTKKVRIRVA